MTPRGRRARPAGSLAALCIAAAALAGAHAFIQPRSAVGLHRARQPSPAAAAARQRARTSVTMQASLRDQFFSAVDVTLAQRFDPNDIQRVLAFVQSCKAGAVPPEAPTSLPYFQPSEEYVPGLTAKPWHDPYSFPWVRPLEEASGMIQEELAVALGQGREAQDFKGDSNVMKVMGAGWTALRLQRLGQWNEDVCARFPKTLELLASLDIPFAVRGVMFARQAAGTGVQPHSDGRNFILTAHLGLQVPPEPGACWMRVAEERRHWAENKVLVIDTTFEHETGNSSDQDRYVLIIDFWHPELTEAERAALRVVYDLRNHFEGRAVMPSAAAPPKVKQPSFFDAVKDMFNTAGR